MYQATLMSCGTAKHDCTHIYVYIYIYLSTIVRVYIGKFDWLWQEFISVKPLAMNK